jgi:Protein of unknown function (DUF2569)
VNNEQQTSAPQPLATQQDTDPFRGVGGFLLIFCVGITVFQPLGCAAEILRNPHDTFVVVLDLGLAAFSIYTGLTTWRARPDALKLIKVYFIVTLALAGLMILRVSANIKEIVQQSPSENPVKTGLLTLMFVAVWWSYFAQSKRVKATFGSNL